MSEMPARIWADMHMGIWLGVPQPDRRPEPPIEYIRADIAERMFRALRMEGRPMSSLSDLIARVENASGPDRRLDAEICCAIRFPDLRPAEPDDHKEFQRGFPPSPGDIWCPTGFLMARSYTRSLDDALTLLPEGWEWELSWIYGRACAKLGNPVLSIDCDGSTPALALVAACLKARLLDAASSEAR